MAQLIGDTNAGVVGLMVGEATSGPVCILSGVGNPNLSTSGQTPSTSGWNVISIWNCGLGSLFLESGSGAAYVKSGAPNTWTLL